MNLAFGDLVVRCVWQSQQKVLGNGYKRMPEALGRLSVLCEERPQISALYTDRNYRVRQ